MYKLSAICLASLLALHAPLSAAQATPATAVAETELAKRIDAAVSGLYKADEPGAILIVTRDGKPVFRKAYGLADVARKTPMDAGMTMRIGSITKQFTAVSILMLADEGKLSLSEDFSKYLPDYPSPGKKITIEQLLTHTSGIPSYTSKPGYMDTAAVDKSVTEMINSFKNDPLDFAPGTRFQYNNSAFFLLGAIIEKLSGQTYAKFVEQRIFVPLAMNNTAFEGHERGANPVAAGHARAEKGFEPSAPVSMSQPYAAGSLVSTVDDMARWDAAIAAGKLLKPATWKQAFTAVNLADGKSTKYGYGWFIGSLQGMPMAYHGGDINGYSAYALRLPEQNTYVAIFTNVERGAIAPALAASKAAAIAAGKPIADYKAVKLDAKAIDALTGQYKMDDKNTYIVRRDGDKLTGQRSGRGQTPLLAYSENGLFVENSLLHLEFKRDAKGEVTEMAMHDGDNVTVRPRIGAVPAERKVVTMPAELFDTYAGRYQLAPGFVIEFTREGDKFITQATGQGKIEMFPSGEAEFFLKVVDAQLRFKKGEDGTMGVVLSQGGREMPGKRLK